MKRTTLALGALWLALAPASAADPSPEAVVKALYAAPHPNRAAVYARRLQGLLDADGRQANGTLDFDDRLDGEPMRPDTAKALTFKEAGEGRDQAKVTVERRGGDG